jgi:outer membrane lipoprotein-sorting protein
MTTIAVSQMGEIPVEVRMSDYKDFGDGVLQPSKVVQKAAGQEYTITIDNVKVNQEVPVGRFDPPAEVKALLTKN